MITKFLHPRLQYKLCSYIHYDYENENKNNINNYNNRQQKHEEKKHSLKKNCKINLFCDSFGIGATISIPGEVQWSPVCRILFYIIRNCFCSFGLLTAFYLYRKVHVCLENIY